MRRLAAMVVVLFLLPAGSAWGQSTVAKDGAGVVTITGSAGNDDVTVSLAADAVTVTVTDTGGIVADAGCVVLATTTVTCGGATTTAINADLGAGHDDFSADATVIVPLTVLGGRDDDVLSGGAGADRLDGGEGADVLSGNQGDDSLDGSSGDDVISGGADGDEIQGEGGNDVLSGDEGDDQLLGGAGDDAIGGGAGADHADGGDGDDLVNGDMDDDVLHGGTGNDELGGGAGNDGVHGDAGNDVVTGSSGADALAGDDGDDLLFGGDGNDQISGGAGADVLSGGPSDDLLDGGPGADSIDGDQGIDGVTYADRAGPVTITLGNGLADDGEPGEGDNVGFGVENATGGSGNDVIVGSSLSNGLAGGPGDDRIDVRDSAADAVSCGDGIDTVLVDAADTSGADCETVSLGAPPAPGPDQQAPPGVPAPEPLVPSLARPRATPTLRIQIAPKRDRRAPYSYLLIGRVRVPSGLDPALACGDLGLISVEVKRGAATLLSLRPRLRANCTFAARVTFKGPKRIHTTKLRFTVSFLGNAYLSPRRAKSTYVRAG